MATYGVRVGHSPRRRQGCAARVHGGYLMTHSPLPAFAILRTLAARLGRDSAHVALSSTSSTPATPSRAAIRPARLSIARRLPANKQSACLPQSLDRSCSHTGTHNAHASYRVIRFVATQPHFHLTPAFLPFRGHAVSDCCLPGVDGYMNLPHHGSTSTTVATATQILEPPTCTEAAFTTQARLSG